MTSQDVVGSVVPYCLHDVLGRCCFHSVCMKSTDVQELQDYHVTTVMNISCGTEDSELPVNS